MRYTRDGSSDWVELAGCAELSMRRLTSLYEGATQAAFDVAAPLCKAWQFTVAGEGVAVGDIPGLTLKQWDWLRGKIVEAARDETLDPEA